MPFSRETDEVGSEGPAQISRAELFAWLETELKELCASEYLPDAGKNEYGRCDKGLAQMLLAKLYLNAQVYAGVEKWQECADVCKTLMDEYGLHKTAVGGKYSAYQELFCADNHKFWRNTTTPSGDEIIFAVEQDGMLIRSYGCTTFLIFAAAGGDMDCEELGISSGWSGVSCPSQLSKLFTDSDARKIFYTEYGIDMKTIMSKGGDAFKAQDSGWKSMKFKNLNIDGSAAQHQTFADADFPMFRLGDVYLMYAECKCRLAGGSNANADGLDQINAIRERAGLSKLASYDLQDVLDERARELYFECHRRSDLVRFGKFTSGDYLWDWKGGQYAGRGVDDHFNLFPIPTDDTNAGKAKQNPGY